MHTEEALLLSGECIKKAMRRSDPNGPKSVQLRKNLLRYQESIKKREAPAVQRSASLVTLSVPDWDEGIQEGHSSKFSGIP